jgi:hypothetical protein
MQIGVLEQSRIGRKERILNSWLNSNRLHLCFVFSNCGMDDGEELVGF